MKTHRYLPNPGFVFGGLCGAMLGMLIGRWPYALTLLGMIIGTYLNHVRQKQSDAE